jgi:hypothetical protein
MKNVLKGLLVGMVVAGACMVNGVSVKADINDSNIKDHYTIQNGDVKTVYNDGSYYINSNVEIQTSNWIDNTVTINKDGQLYSFYVNNVRDYYLGEIVNVTMDNNNKIVDCIVDTQPVVYKNVSVIDKDNDLIYVNINGDKYAFDNEDGDDGWNVNDKVNVIMQNDKILEVRPYLDK